MHYDAPSEAAAAKAARLESGRDCICQMALIHYCLHCMLFFTQILQDCCPQIPYRYDTNSVIFFQPVASVSVSLFSKVLSAIFWMMLVIFRGLLIPMRCVADLHFCLASGVLGGGVFTTKYHGWYAVCIRTFHILFQMFGFFYIFLSRSKISSHWHCKRRECHKVEL